MKIAEYIQGAYPSIYEEAKEVIGSAEKPCKNKTALLFIIASEKDIDTWQQRLLFIAASLLLFSPETLKGGSKIRHRVGKMIAEELGVTHNAISYHVNSARHYYKNVEPFKNKVEEITKEVRDE